MESLHLFTEICGLVVDLLMFVDIFFIITLYHHIYKCIHIHINSQQDNRLRNLHCCLQCTTVLRVRSICTAAVCRLQFCVQDNYPQQTGVQTVRSRLQHHLFLDNRLPDGPAAESQLGPSPLYHCVTQYRSPTRLCAAPLPLLSHDWAQIHHTNTIIKFADDTTVV